MCFPSFSSNLRTFTMFTHIFLVLLLTISFLIDARPAPRGFLINCGSSENITVRNLKFIADEGLISVGNTTALKMSGVLPVLSTLRLFPDVSARKYCYVLPAVKGTKYLVRTTYYYGGFDGGNQPPIFDQIVDGTKWSVVNTTDDYANGLASYYELVVAAHMNELSVCLARNQHTDDEFHRFWQPFKDTNPTVTCQSNVTPSDFWNMPPVKALKNAITTSRGKTLQIQWLPVSLPPSNYYISLYFQDNRNPSAYSWRVFNISINGELFYSKLNVTAKGVSVYAIEWPLSGQTRMTLIPEDGIPVGPLINAAEVLQILPLGGMTLTRDVMAMEDLARSLDNAPADWHGDPCLPQQNSWTGVTCSGEKNVARVVTLNLTSMGLTGSLPPSIVNLTAVNNIWLAHNKLSGLIPDISSLKVLETFHLDNNQFEGSIPKSLGELPRIQEIYLQHNNLEGEVPESLRNRPDVDIRLTPRNNLRESKNNG